MPELFTGSELPEANNNKKLVYPELSNETSENVIKDIEINIKELDDFYNKFEEMGIQLCEEDKKYAFQHIFKITDEEMFKWQESKLFNHYVLKLKQKIKNFIDLGADEKKDEKTMETSHNFLKAALITITLLMASQETKGEVIENNLDKNMNDTEKNISVNPEQNLKSETYNALDHKF